jgi:LAS superfamily LD-carboxypeptidase LdcB
LTEELQQPARRRDFRPTSDDTQTQTGRQGPTRRELRLAEQARLAAVPPSGAAESAPDQVDTAMGTLLAAVPVVAAEASDPVGGVPGAAAVAVLRTRRELRLAEQEACRRPFPLIESVAVAHPVDRPRAARHHRAGKSVLAVALSAALLVSGFSLYESEEARASMQAAAQTAEAQRLQIARVSTAEANRLTAQANAYAHTRRAAAVVAAQNAMDQADAVVRTATPVVEAAALTPLDAAVAELETLLAETAPAALETETEPAAARAMAATRTSRSDDARPPVAEAAAAAETGPDARAEAAEEARAADVVPDLAAIEEVEAAAAEVAALSSQVQATADARIAEAAQRAVEEAAAAELARKVAATEAAGNGAIPSDLLCAPDFASDELLRCDAAEALERLNDAYRADFGHDLDVVSSYRSYSMQVATRASRGWLAAVPGTSNHGLAVALDFGNFGAVGSFSHPNYRWMKENAEEFGWFHPRMMEPGGGGPLEPWHWEFGTDEDATD